MKPRKLLLGCGVASSLLYVLSIDVLAAVAHPEYHSHTHRMVSELFAAAAPTRPLLGPPMVLYNLLVFAFAVGVWSAAEGKRAARTTALALALYGAISTIGFFMPMDVRGPAGVTERDVVHIVATSAQGVAMVLALVLGAFAHGLRFRVYSFATLATCVVFGAVAGLFAARESSPWLGTTERVSVYAWMLWIAALAIAFLRAPDARAPSEAAASPQGPTRLAGPAA